MSDSLFITKPANAMMNARLNRVEGAVPYIRRTSQVFSNSKVKAPSQGSVEIVASGNQASGQINPYSGISAVGNAFPFVIQGRLGATTTANSITLYWDGTNNSQIFVIKRTDGTSFTVSSGSMTISGLQPSTFYGFLPYNKTTNQDNLSFSLGDSGSPMFAFSPTADPALIATANQNQKMASSEAVTSGFVYFQTTAAGTAAVLGNPGVLAPYSNVRFPPGTSY